MNRPNSMNNKCFIVSSFCIMLLVGCREIASTSTPAPDQMDRSPFTGIPCKAPCWYGLEIGKPATEEEVFSVLEGLSFIDTKSIYAHKMLLCGMDPNDEIWGVEIRANCKYNNELCIRIAVGNNLLISIENKLTYAITLEEVKLYLQEPDYLGYISGVVNISCRQIFIWKSKQLVLYSQKYTDAETADDICNKKNQERPDNEIIISDVRYASPLMIDYIMAHS
jgi:hypothetical protein